MHRAVIGEETADDALPPVEDTLEHADIIPKKVRGSGFVVRGGLEEEAGEPAKHNAHGVEAREDQKVLLQVAVRAEQDDQAHARARE